MPGTPTTTPPGPTNPLGQLPATGELRLINNALNKWDGAKWVLAVIPVGQLSATPVFKDPATGMVTLSNGLVVAGGVTADTLAVSGSLHANGGLVVAGGAQVDSLGVTGTATAAGLLVTGNSHVQGNEQVDGTLTAAASHITGNEQVDGSATVNGVLNAVGDARLNGVPLPRGRTQSATFTTNITGITTAGVDLISMSQTLVTGRRYSVRAGGWGVGSTVANTDFYEVEIFDWHNNVALDYFRGWCGPAAGGVYGSWKLEGFVTGDGAAHLITAPCQRVVGTGTLTAFAQSGRFTWMEITDVGT